MSVNTLFTKDNLDTYLKELSKVFKKLNGKKMPAEIILIGGASILANYGFRETTYDIDAVIMASSVIKEAIDIVGEKFGLPIGWLNMDFKNTKSYSKKLNEVSVHYKTFSNILTVRTIAAEYLIAMKLMAGRKYKYDISDIAGILLEHQKNGNPITQEAVNKAVITLYGSWENISPDSKKLIDMAFTYNDYETLYIQNRNNEIIAMEIITEFNKNYPDKLKSENINSIIEQARLKLGKENKLV